MLKSQKIDESKAFYDLFFENIGNLTSAELKKLYSSNIDILNKALNYFKSKDGSFELLEHSIKNSFTVDTTIIMNETTDNNKEKQLKINSLEDESNPIRTIFTVDMLNEGWDVLNLFDIVRLYDTRQGSGKAGKIGSYTIREAQLIGRGARYCPFKINDEQERYKRKYDSDLDNDLRILETMYFHSRNDSSYIAELKQALIETGLQDNDPIKLEYKLKDTFKNTDFYNNGLLYSNKRILKSRDVVTDIEDGMKTKVYRYTVKTNKGKIVNLMDEEQSTTNVAKNLKSIKFKDIDYNILEGATERFHELKFNVIKSKYPNVDSMKEFLTSDKYLGNCSLEIAYADIITGVDLRNACIKACSEISKYVTAIKQEYEGTKEFEPIKIKDVIVDKSIYLSKIDENGGKGDSQSNCRNENYRLNLIDEEWYVYNDNYGTSEEKMFIKYFKTNIEPKLIDKELEYYVIRNERIPSLAIYSFEHGERFEPDFLLLAKKKNVDSFDIYQLYIEPKGSNLLDEDKWKEDFMLELDENVYANSLFDYANTYKIRGLPFYNEEYRKSEFENAVNEWINSI